MTNIPKKIGEVNKGEWMTEFSLRTAHKVDELIDYLEAEEEVQILKRLEEVCGEEASKGECEHHLNFKKDNGDCVMCVPQKSKKERRVTVIHKGEYDDDWKEDEITLPPEHEEETVDYKLFNSAMEQDWKVSVVGGIKYADVGRAIKLTEEHINKYYVSKEKIKREMGEYFYNYVADKLGLGD